MNVSWPENEQVLIHLLKNVPPFFFADTKEFSLFWLQTEMEFRSWKVKIKEAKFKAQLYLDLKLVKY